MTGFFRKKTYLYFPDRYENMKCDMADIPAVTSYLHGMNV